MRGILLKLCMSIATLNSTSNYANFRISSYSSRLAKTSDYSPHKPPVSRNSRKEDQRTPPSKSPSPLSVPNAHPTHGDEIKGSEDSQIKAELNSKDKIVIDDNLHFSMYKWASKGVTLILPPNLKDKSKVRSRLGVYAQVSQEPDLPLDKENLPQGIPIIQNPDVPEDVTITRSPNPSPVKTKKAPGVLRDITDKSGMYLVSDSCFSFLFEIVVLEH